MLPIAIKHMSQCIPFGRLFFLGPEKYDFDTFKSCPKLSDFENKSVRQIFTIGYNILSCMIYSHLLMGDCQFATSQNCNKNNFTLKNN